MKFHPSSLCLSEQKEYYHKALKVLNDIYFDFSDLNEIISDYSLTLYPPSLTSSNAFFDLVINGQLTSVDLENFLIEININMVDKVNNTALLWACNKGHLKLASLLLYHGADINHRNFIGKTALMISCFNYHPEISSLLISKGADINIQDKSKNTALLLSKDIETISLLLSHGANINHQNNNGDTLLILSSINGDAEMVSQLLSLGAVSGINICNDDGNTALMEASSHYCNAEIVSVFLNTILVSNGANVNIENNIGETALELAHQYHYPPIESILKSHGATFKE